MIRIIKLQVRMVSNLIIIIMINYNNSGNNSNNNYNIVAILNYMLREVELEDNRDLEALEEWVEEEEQ